MLIATGALEKNLQARHLEDTTIALTEAHFADPDLSADLPMQDLDVPDPIAGWLPEGWDQQAVCQRCSSVVSWVIRVQ